MTTLAPGGRITTDVVDAEIERLRQSWRSAGHTLTPSQDLTTRLLGDGASELDRFERVQLEEVLRTCRTARSMSEAGRSLFSESRKKKSSSNDADRLRKYLARFGLRWQDIVDGTTPG